MEFLPQRLGLMTAAFLIDRVAPPKDEPAPLPSKEVRDASPAGLAAESGDHGRQAKSPAEIPAKGWKDILCASTATSATTGFWLWPPA